MNIQLIQGEFTNNDALELITQLIHTEIKYHENKIIQTRNEEDRKSRQLKIKQLQKGLFEVTKDLNLKLKKVKVDAVIKID